MADSKISALTELTAAAYEEDVLEIVDASASANKKIVAATLLGPSASEETGASYTFALTDAFKTKSFNSGSAQTITIPTNASVAFPIGTRIRCFRKGAGLPKIVADGGVTLNLPTGIAPKRFMGCLTKKASDATGVNYSSDTNITWDTDVYDTDAFHDTGSNTDRITVPSNLGIKKVSLAYSIRTANNAGYVASSLKKDGTAITDVFETNIFNNSTGQMVRSIDVSDGTYFQASMSSSDSSIDVTAATSFFQIEVIEIDAQGYISYRYGAVEIEKIGTNEWIFIDQSALG